MTTPRKLAFPRRRTGGARLGLTLMELVVVLAVLVALAALAIPMFPNLLRRAHKATDATQTQEMAKLVQLYQGMYTSYPDEFDLLTDGTTFPSYIPADGGKVFGGFVEAKALTADEVAALRRVGISNVHKLATTLAATPPQPTLDPYETPYASSKTAIDTTMKFAVIDPANPDLPTNFLAPVRAANPTARFVVFGVGSRCSMIGKVVQDAPTSVPQNKDFTPATLYSRIGVVFMVSGDEVVRSERARFIAAVALEDDELEMTEKDIVGYYQVAR